MASRHKNEIEKNRTNWQNKELLRRVYQDIHQQIARFLRPCSELPSVEIGSGIGHIKDTIPGCVTTDLTPGPGIDQVEDIYHLSFSSGDAANFILVHVFHHLEFPGQALKEMHRVLAPGGRVVIFEPYISLLGLLVYGPCHAEPIALRQPIQWVPPGTNPDKVDIRPENPHPESGSSSRAVAGNGYYAAQGNATRIFARQGFERYLKEWQQIECRPIAHFSYILSGGYSGPQLYPTQLWPLVKKLDCLASSLPSLLGTSLMVVLEKKHANQC